MNEIFLTGATGLAGSSALQELRSRSLRVKAFVRPTFAPLTSSEALTVVTSDLKDTLSLKKEAFGNSGIVHYACASLRGMADIQIDIDALNALLLTWEKGPFVYISSIDVYGLPTEKDVDENYSLSGSLNAYSEGKIACENLIFENAKRRGRTDFTILRAPWIFAPNLRSKQQIQERFLNHFPEAFTLPCEDRTEFDQFGDTYVDARDLAWLACEALINPLGGAGNVVGEWFSWVHFFEFIKGITNDSRLILHLPKNELSDYDSELFGQTATFDGSKINQHFKFKPKFNLNKTLLEIFEIRK